MCARLSAELAKERERVVESAASEASLAATCRHQAEQMKRLDAQILALREEGEAAATRCQQLQRAQAEAEREEAEARRALEASRVRQEQEQEGASLAGLQQSLAASRAAQEGQNQQCRALALRVEE
jgi:hypothetical protein